MPLRYVGFCGADDSVDASLLGAISARYPFVEWGVLFRPDKEGTPRYASTSWVTSSLFPVWRRHNGAMKLAAHLCGTRVNDLLAGDATFVRELSALGFRRFQINATAVNGVDTDDLAGKVPAVLGVMAANRGVDFIIQRSAETAPLWEGLLAACGGSLPPNCVMLFDESKGTGVSPAGGFGAVPERYDVGFAGGIGPKNITEVVKQATERSGDRVVWIDMESSLRTMIEGVDTFDVNKCFKCIRAVCEAGIFEL